MALKAVSVATERRFALRVRPRLVPVMILALAALSTAMPGSTVEAFALRTGAPEDAPLTARDAARLLDQISAGLISHNRQKSLAAFDLARMSDGRLFAQQVTSFLAHTGDIRVHYSGIETTMEDQRAVVAVDFEMEADLRDEDLPPLHKQARLRLVAENASAGWKLTDVQPRSFFSLDQP